MEECAELTAQEQRTKGRPTADSDGADRELFVIQMHIGSRLDPEGKRDEGELH